MSKELEKLLEKTLKERGVIHMIGHNNLFYVETNRKPEPPGLRQDGVIFRKPLKGQDVTVLGALKNALAQDNS